MTHVPPAAMKRPSINVTPRRVLSHCQHPPCYRATVRDSAGAIILMVECADKRKARRIARVYSSGVQQ